MSQHATAEWQDAWVDALRELEVDVERAEALLAGKHADQDLPRSGQWQPPVGLGPLPEDLRGRAQEIFERQVAVSVALGQAMLGNRRHAALAARIETGGDGGRPAYVDWAI